MKQSGLSCSKLVRIKMLNVLVSTISNSQVFLLKNVSSFCIFNDQSFNNTLTNDFISFEQLGPDQVSIFL